MKDTSIDELTLFDSHDEEAVGLRIQAVFVMSGFRTKGEFGATIGMSNQVATNITSGNNYPRPNHLRALLKHYRTSPSFILFGHYGEIPIEMREQLFEALSRVHKDRASKKT